MTPLSKWILWFITMKKLAIGLMVLMAQVLTRITLNDLLNSMALLTASHTGLHYITTWYILIIGTGMYMLMEITHTPFQHGATLGIMITCMAMDTTTLGIGMSQ